MAPAARTKALAARLRHFGCGRREWQSGCVFHRLDMGNLGVVIRALADPSGSVFRAAFAPQSGPCGGAAQALKFH